MGDLELPKLGETIRLERGDDVLLEGVVERVYGDAVSVWTEDGARFLTRQMLDDLPEGSGIVVVEAPTPEQPSGYL